jgi:hypothetical protein
MSDLAAQVASLQNTVASLQSTNDQLNNNLANMQLLNQYVTVDLAAENGVKGPNITFHGANIHIVSGYGATNDPVTGLGNLIVGYNEPDAGNPFFPPPTNYRFGSHNLILGEQNWFSLASYASFVGGKNNKARSDHAFLGTGEQNQALASFAAIVGGEVNEVKAPISSILGGQNNSIVNLTPDLSALAPLPPGEDGWFATIVGGNENQAVGPWSTVLGGQDNFSSNYYSTAIGGHDTLAQGRWSVTLGGGSFTSSGPVALNDYSIAPQNLTLFP